MSDEQGNGMKNEGASMQYRARQWTYSANPFATEIRQRARPHTIRIVLEKDMLTGQNLILASSK